ncbi:MAG: hypothetical protein IJR14_10565 [Synergistaceae bacterium]|nr:hypothetical protein [Synergistaceae bacterium]
MQSTWREAFAHVWGNFTGVSNEGSARTWRLLFFLLFLLGSAFAVYSYLKLKELREEKYFSPSVTPTSVEADKKRLDGMVSEVRDASTRRSNSYMSAQVMRDLNKYVFDPPSSTLDPVEYPEDRPLLAQPPTPEPPVVPPPDITVKAIMVMGKTRVAVMDIAGVGSGMLVRPGDTFMNRKGRIVRIADDRVVVRWDGKTWNVAP